ncbi:hypothetical protein K440DRAFT_109833 [Wilcoxina mikolae CBS 423.85]|nr:hypothetical protein K440DRAFT_109833 [Wilcoxina mikolae CBS 423.85]
MPPPQPPPPPPLPPDQYVSPRKELIPNFVNHKLCVHHVGLGWLPLQESSHSSVASRLTSSQRGTCLYLGYGYVKEQGKGKGHHISSFFSFSVLFRLFGKQRSGCVRYSDRPLVKKREQLSHPAYPPPSASSVRMKTI